MARPTLLVALVTVGLAVPAVGQAQGRNAPAGSSSAGTAEARGSGGSGGSSGGGSGSTASAGSSGSASGSPSSGYSSTTVPGSGRDRSGQPIVGTAVPRGAATALPGSVFGPFGRFTPWYSGSLGYGVGFVQYDPFGYGAYGGLLWGPWYDPFFYDPFNPFGYGYTGFRYGGYALPEGQYGAARTATHVTGSIRFKVSPNTAQVYIDGVLAGTAREFDGLLSHHLTLEAGSHQLELRADGFETYKETITVDASKTLTERVSLKKPQK